MSVIYSSLLTEQALRAGLDVLVGTPGRIYDHIEKGNLDLSKVKHVVLDEVDQMLDMGFAEIVDNILQHAYLEGWLSHDSGTVKVLILTDSVK